MNFNTSTAILVFAVEAAVGCNDTTRVMLTAPSPATPSTPPAPTLPAGAMAGKVSLTGAKFTEHHGAFDLHVAGDYVIAELGDAHGGAGIVEEVAEDSYLLFGGGFKPAVVDPSTIEGALVGAVDFCIATNGLQYGDRCPAGAATHVHCPSPNHRLMMRRRGSGTRTAAFSYRLSAFSRKTDSRSLRAESARRQRQWSAGLNAIAVAG